MDEHPHRFLEFATTGRAKCSGKCGKLIPEGTLRYGTKVVIQDHQGTYWRCLRCITKRQAQNLIKDSEIEKKTEHDFLTVAPSLAIGGHGPSEAVVDAFLHYIFALADDDTHTTKETLKELQKHTAKKDMKHDVAEARAAAAVKAKGDKSPEAKDGVDTKVLDAQVLADPYLIDMFRVDDLRALCEHHGLHIPKTGVNKRVLVDLLEDGYYDKKQEAGPPKTSGPKHATHGPKTSKAKDLAELAEGKKATPKKAAPAEGKKAKAAKAKAR